MNIDSWLGRQFPNPPCWELVAAVYFEVLGQGVTEFKTIDSSIRGIASAFRLALHKGEHGFSRIDTPKDFAVVLMGKSPELGLHHAGVFFDDKILHALATGNYYDDLSVMQDTYPVMEFWAK